MKNKKGFTLVEILVVIVVLMSVTTGTIFGMQKIQESSEEKQLNEIITEIEEAADIYINMNPVYIEDLLNNPSTTKCTKVYILQNEGLLDVNLINPKTQKRIPGNLCVYSKVVNGTIVNEFNFEA